MYNTTTKECITIIVAESAANVVALSNLARGTFTLPVDLHLGVPFFALYFFTFPRVGTSKRAMLSLPDIFHKNKTGDERRKNFNKEKKK